MEAKKTELDIKAADVFEREYEALVEKILEERRATQAKIIQEALNSEMEKWMADPMKYETKTQFFVSVQLQFEMDAEIMEELRRKCWKVLPDDISDLIESNLYRYCIQREMIWAKQKEESNKVIQE